MAAQHRRALAATGAAAVRGRAPGPGPPGRPGTGPGPRRCPAGPARPGQRPRPHPAGAAWSAAALRAAVLAPVPGQDGTGARPGRVLLDWAGSADEERTMADAAGSRRRWETDDRFTGVADAGVFADSAQELAQLARRPGWVAEEPEVHLVPHLQSASVPGLTVLTCRQARTACWTSWRSTAPVTAVAISAGGPGRCSGI